MYSTFAWWNEYKLEYCEDSPETNAMIIGCVRKLGHQFGSLNQLTCSKDISMIEYSIM